jgi:hypothetical protein
MENEESDLRRGATEDSREKQGMIVARGEFAQ